MTQANRHHHNRWENAPFLNLLVAFFTPIDLHDGKLEINTAMLSAYAMLYTIRNSIAALVTYAVGALLYEADYVVAGTMVTGLFVLFAGLFGAFLVVTLDNYRNHS